MYGLLIHSHLGLKQPSLRVVCISVALWRAIAISHWQSRTSRKWILSWLFRDDQSEAHRKRRKCEIPILNAGLHSILENSKSLRGQMEIWLVIGAMCRNIKSMHYCFYIILLMLNDKIDYRPRRETSVLCSISRTTKYIHASAKKDCVPENSVLKYEIR